VVAPEQPRVISFIDLQWWLRASKFAFDQQLPNLNPAKLTVALAKEHGWDVAMVRAYVDVPTQQSSLWWHQLWRNRIDDLEQSGVIVNATLQRTRTAWAVNGNEYEKVSVRSDVETPFHLIQDAVADVALNSCDVVLLFTRETKYLELTEYLKSVAVQQKRWLKIVSAFPYQADAERHVKYNAHNGIDKTDWIRVGYELNRECTDYIRKPVLDQPVPDTDAVTVFGTDRIRDTQNHVTGTGTGTGIDTGDVEELSVDDIFVHSSVSEEEYERYLRGEVEVDDSCLP
jgi:hypothetical protein